MSDIPDPHRTGRRRAITLTTIILIVVLGLAFAFSLTMTRRLIATWNPWGPPATHQPPP